MKLQSEQPLRVFVISGEASGDQLGARILREMRGHIPLTLAGVGGPAMAAEGLISLFEQHDITAMGFTTVFKRLPLLLNRLRACVEAAVAFQPDLLLLIDSPDFTLRAAKRIRARNSRATIVKYVSPSVWAWRPGRAAAMRPFVDHILALLPFEPQVHRRLGGPACSYVGHPLTEQRTQLRPQTVSEAEARTAKPARLLLLPGSRRSELAHLLPPFRQALELLRQRGHDLHVTLPAVPHLAPSLRQAVAEWAMPVEIVEGDEAKQQAFRCARAALAASGTVTLELAVAGVPSVVAYRGGWLEANVAKALVRTPHVALSNLVLGARVMPEFMQEQATPAALAEALAAILADGSARQAQLDAFSGIDAIMSTGDETPSALAARIALEAVTRHRRELP